VDELAKPVDLAAAYRRRPKGRGKARQGKARQGRRQRGSELSTRGEGQAVTDIQGEQFVHRELWRVVGRQLAHAEANPKGSFYDHLVAMVFAFLSLEAYLNFAGARLDSATWQNERTSFRGNGFQRKLAKVSELAGIALDPSSRPLTTIRDLNKLRDMMAHGKTLPIAETLHHTVGEPPPLNHGPLDALVSRQQAETAMADVLEVAQRIHMAAATRIQNDPWWGDSPFDGITLHAGGSTRIDVRN